MRILISLIILFINTNIFSQKWDHIFGTPNHTETPKDVIECYDKGYMISGSYKIPTSSNWLIKTDINGDILWDKVILHDLYGVYSGAIAQNSSGDVVLARSLVVNSETWPSVIKLDSCGNKIWCRVYIDDNYIWGGFNDVILYENGDVLALGWLESEEEIDKIFLYYIESNGNLMWRKSYASKNNHPLVKERIGRGFHQFNNEYIITGWCYYPYPSNPNTGYIRPFFIGVDNEFEEKWILPYGVNDSIYGEATNIISLNDSVYMGVGFVWETGSDQNTVFMYFNSDGEELGYEQIYNESIGSLIEDNVTVDVARLNDSLFITSILYGEDEATATYGDFIVDTSANIYKFEQRSNTTGTSSIIKTFDNKYVIGCTYRHLNNNKDIYLYKINDSLEMDTVYPGNYTYDSLCPYQIQSGIIDITDCLLITDVREVPTPKEYFASLNTVPIKAYPNPVNDGEITFEFQNTKHHQNMELRCFNIFGKQVHEEQVYQHQGESKINLGDWNSGMYVALVYSNGEVVGQCKFVVQ